MQALSHSAFLQALGYAIVNSLWQMALLWIVVVLLNSIFSFSSHTRYKIALGAQFTGFTWFIVTLQYYFAKCAEAMQEIKDTGFINGPEFIKPEAANFNTRLWATMLKTEQLLPYLSLAYLLLLSFLVFKWIKGYRNTQLIRTQGLQKIDISWKLFVQRMSEHLDIEKKIRIYVSSIVKSPLTIGFLKPVILIPVASVNHLSVQQMEAVILHELAHIKRADYLINLVQCIIEITLFFNPFSQLISRFIKKEREHSCDDWVLQFQYNPTMYAEALLQLAYLNTSTPAFAMGATGHSKGDLLSRVRRMLNQKEKTFTYKHQLFAFLLMTFILSSIAWFDPSSAKENNNVAVKPANVNAPVVIEPVTASADNPLFNPVFFLNSDLKDEIKKATKTITEQTADITTKSIAAAHDALVTAVPAALKTVENINIADWKNIPEADKIQEELDKANAEIKKFDLAKLIDTLKINAAIRQEFAKANIDFDKAAINMDLQKANKELSALSFLQYIPKEEREKVKISVQDALKQIGNLNFKFDWKEQKIPPAPAAPVPEVSISARTITVPKTVLIAPNSRPRLRQGQSRRIKLTSPDNKAVIAVDSDEAQDVSNDASKAEEAAPDVEQQPEINNDDADNKATVSYGVSSNANGIGYVNPVNNGNWQSQTYHATNATMPAGYYNYNYNSEDALNKAFSHIDMSKYTPEQKNKLFKLKRYLRAVKNYQVTEKQVCNNDTKKNSVVLEIVVYQ